MPRGAGRFQPWEFVVDQPWLWVSVWGTFFGSSAKHKKCGRSLVSSCLVCETRCENLRKQGAALQPSQVVERGSSRLKSRCPHTSGLTRSAPPVGSGVNLLASFEAAAWCPPLIPARCWLQWRRPETRRVWPVMRLPREVAGRLPEGLLSHLKACEAPSPSCSGCRISEHRAPGHHAELSPPQE